LNNFVLQNSCLLRRNFGEASGAEFNRVSFNTPILQQFRKINKREILPNSDGYFQSGR
jgi:hypothetical protein